MKKKIILFILLVLMLSACSSKTMISEEVVFEGEGKLWNVKYYFNPEQYDEKKVNWVQLYYKGSELTEADLVNIEIELEGRDGVITGNLGDMETKIEGDRISFLVGTVNGNTYQEDDYKITITFKNERDVIKLEL